MLAFQPVPFVPDELLELSVAPEEHELARLAVSRLRLPGSQRFQVRVYDPTFPEKRVCVNFYLSSPPPFVVPPTDMIGVFGGPEIKAKFEGWLHRRMSIMRAWAKIYSLVSVFDDPYRIKLEEIEFVFPGIRALGNAYCPQTTEKRLPPFKVPANVPTLTPQLRVLLEEAKREVTKALVLPELESGDKPITLSVVGVSPQTYSLGNNQSITCYLNL